MASALLAGREVQAADLVSYSSGNVSSEEPQELKFLAVHVNGIPGQLEKHCQHAHDQGAAVIP